MAKVYYNLIKNGRLDIEDVPLKWREAVKELMVQNNNDNNNE